MWNVPEPFRIHLLARQQFKHGAHIFFRRLIDGRDLLSNLQLLCGCILRRDHATIRQMHFVIRNERHADDFKCAASTEEFRDHILHLSRVVGSVAQIQLVALVSIDADGDDVSATAQPLEIAWNLIDAPIRLTLDTIFIESVGGEFNFLQTTMRQLEMRESKFSFTVRVELHCAIILRRVADQLPIAEQSHVEDARFQFHCRAISAPLRARRAYDFDRDCHLIRDRLRRCRRFRFDVRDFDDGLHAIKL